MQGFSFFLIRNAMKKNIKVPYFRIGISLQAIFVALIMVLKEHIIAEQKKGRAVPLLPPEAHQSYGIKLDHQIQGKKQDLAGQEINRVQINPQHPFRYTTEETRPGSQTV